MKELSSFFDYVVKYYFDEKAVYPASTWSYYDPDSDGIHAVESSTNNAAEINNAILKSLIPNSRLKFSSSIEIVLKFHRKASK